MIRYTNLDEVNKSKCLSKMMIAGWKPTKMKMNNYNMWDVKVSESTWECLEKDNIFIPIKDLWYEVDEK